MAKDLTQKTYDFMNEEEPKKKEVKKIKATLFQKIILGAMISVPIVVPSCAYLVNKEVERMRKEAEEHAEEDEKRKGEVETINQADALVYSTKKLFKLSPRA